MPDPDDGGLRSLGQKFAASPAWQILAAGLVLAFAFPARSSGAIGLTIIGGALGIGVAALWPRLPDVVRRPPTDITTLLVIAVVIAAGVTVFWDTIVEPPDWPMGDWGPQHAVLANIMPSLPGFDYPTWNHALATGDAPLELYPSLAYLLTGHLAWALGIDDLSHALMIVAVIVHLVIAAGTTLLALRVASKPIACIVGLAAVVDSGAIAHGGTVGLFRWALLHSALALSFATLAATCVLSALRKPRLVASIGIWVFTALAVIAHPAGLIAAAASIVALVAVGLLASDIPPRRALIAAGHIILGVALGAAVWMPLAERILEYGQHFPNPLRTPAKLLEDLLAAPAPVTSYALLGYAAYFGIIAGLWSRRAIPVFIATSALVLLLGICDAVYLAFDLAPGQAVARLGAERLAQFARPFTYAMSAYGISVIITAIRGAWVTAPIRQRWIAAALLGTMCGALSRAVPDLWWNASARAGNEAKVFALDPVGRYQLVDWARQRMTEQTPGSYGRAVFETDTHEHMHLTALTGLPTFHNSWLPDLLLRERIEDLSEASLRRFNVRWVIASGQSPTFGDPSTERILGLFHIREVPGWDGQFARIESGSGTVKTTRLDDRAVEIEVTAQAPVLVVLGTAFYPRWRATHASGAAERVYAQPTIPGGRLHVVSAWVAPGKTTFTVDGPLPSDGKGRGLAIIALVTAIAIVVAWSVRRFRIRMLRRLARVRARSLRLLAPTIRIGTPVIIAILLMRGCIEAHGITRAIELGTGLRATATVEARLHDGDWQTCDYARTEGTYYCDQLLMAYDGMAATLNDAPPSWGFNTPAITLEPQDPRVEARITLPARLGGTYWIASSDGSFTLTVDGEVPREVTRSIETFDDVGERTVTLTTSLASVVRTFTAVREDTLQPPREFLAPPPPVAPASVQAIQ